MRLTWKWKCLFDQQLIWGHFPIDSKWKSYAPEESLGNFFAFNRASHISWFSHCQKQTPSVWVLRFHHEIPSRISSSAVRRDHWNESFACEFLTIFRCANATTWGNWLPLACVDMLNKHTSDTSLFDMFLCIHRNHLVSSSVCCAFLSPFRNVRCIENGWSVHNGKADFMCAATTTTTSERPNDCPMKTESRYDSS